MSPSRLSVKRILIAGFGVMALLASSCGGSSGETVDTAADAPDAAASEVAAPAESEGDADGSPEPADVAFPTSLVASTVAGGQIDFGSLAGQDVVLWFWAPW